MMQDKLALARQIAQLASSRLTTEESEHLVSIINQLFIDIEHGHSCSRVDIMATSINLTCQVILDVVTKSGIASNYSLDMLDDLVPLPLSIWHTSDGSYIYITRYLSYEVRIGRYIKQLMTERVCFDENKFNQVSTVLTNLQHANGLPNQDQLNAILRSCQHQLSIITGGPGTGKTTTVMLLLWALFQLYSQVPKVKICAPTGKAANRVKDSIYKSLQDKQINVDTTILKNTLRDDCFSTIHKVLGYRKNSIYFQHNHDNPLDCDILIVDESSMIGLPLFSKLLDALNLHTIKHIIFLGDKNQLSSVEEGYVFASLVDVEVQQINYAASDLFNQFSYQPLASYLHESKRNQEAIALLSNAILNNDAPLVNQCLKDEHTQLHPPLLTEVLRTNYSSNSPLMRYLQYVQEQDSLVGSIGDLMQKFTTQANLCMTNSGVLGSVNLNHEIERMIKIKFGFDNEWYSGRPVMILENNYPLDLYNGDVGICLVYDGKAKIYFAEDKSFAPEVLPKFALAYAITIHKSQGSEYEHVNVILPHSSGEEMQSLLTRELVYTAVTRAKRSVTLFSQLDTLHLAMNNSSKRISGLSHLLK
ncbi:MAG: exodeoxyribonuclease V subunit alpha [Proteobacteria bacterium]|nr:MAG: exodeoxyribonuclease V subunit alpha [Pseudomonadota bacterium]